MKLWMVLLIIVIILAVVLAVLYFLGKKAQKKQEAQQAQIEASKQTVSMLVIDKKRMPLKEAGLPQMVIDTEDDEADEAAGGEGKSGAEDYDTDQ